ncbi:peptidyl-tRNA hydrolase [Companilactobacillus nodensis DSM 19682 = JCM 14932 = NBRC 107160]|uniref:Peptidyl-tRNA hydrolase n=1 Tax=Companilactobacillus nodensis DSM 19682 = JCM 14932 = NBRC 107160 TaxID=1423775 RepID=A0A0R1K7M6_9LACO|nr:aminoacyl-tRNA hydrolase [Companilactobacillus nodensis]KRK79654.1 peptidyl-tRNA hydrolase [Companilactobacillus nodensis DSM 19682 = JCM 14932 = NBRC 107160]
MKLIVGLGNPGKKYDRTKHNMGFMTIDKLMEEYNQTQMKKDFEAEYCKFKVDGETVFLVKPLTFMNESGRAVKFLTGYYQIKPEEIMVIQDDLDMPIGKIRLRAKGSAGGHNGIKSIIASMGTKDFKRIKIGIQHPDKQTVVNWVLTPFTKDQAPVALTGIDNAASAVKDWIAGDTFDQLMNKYN